MQSAGMIFFILLFGGIAASIWTGLNRNHAEIDIKIYSLKSILFFFAGIYFAVSAVKLYLGEAENTLPESFWDVEGMTYLHYGIVFAAISVIVPLLMKWFLLSYGYNFVHIFDSLYVVVLMAGMFWFGRIDNRTYCILYAVCLLAGGIVSLYNQKPLNKKKCSGGGLHDLQQIEYIGRDDFKLRFIEALPFVSAWVVMTGIYFPNELYIHNMEEFAGSYAAFFLIMLAGSITEILFLLLVFLLFLPKKLFRVTYLLCAGISCAGYLQGMFLNGALAAMNGSEQRWSNQELFVNGCIWLAILLAAVIGGYRRAAVRKISRLLCIYISLIQIAALGWLVLTSDTKNENGNAAITNKGALELAQEDNVLVFVLDNFDSSWFEEICQDDSSILEPLADFTYYRNGTSQFAHTDTGIPYMLTGMEWDAGQGNYFEYAYENSDVLERIAEQGTDVRIFTELPLMPEKLYRTMDNYSDTAVRKYNITRTFRTMIRTSMYKTAPFLIKPRYEYYSSDINDMSYNNDIWSIHNDLLFYQNIVENGLRISDTESAFRFYHMRGPHAPFYLTADLKYEPTGRSSSMESQGKGSLKIVYAYMEQLKALGKYDAATIIITADHGQGNISDTEKYSGQPDKTSRTMFLVKRSGEHHANMEVSEAPVSQAELLPTILSALGMEHASCGRTFEEIPVDEKRVRRYIDIYGNYNVEYVIDGHAADLDSWSIGRAVYY